MGKAIAFAGLRPDSCAQPGGIIASLAQGVQRVNYWVVYKYVLVIPAKSLPRRRPWAGIQSFRGSEGFQPLAYLDTGFRPDAAPGWPFPLMADAN
jgi:hypothetical protein